MTTQAQTATLGTLHTLLAAGVTLLGVAFAVLTLLGRVPLMPREGQAPFVAEIFAGVQLVMLAVAWFIFKPQIPVRAAAQSVQAYLAVPETIARILRVWFLCEGASILGAVAYGLTGNIIPAAVGVVALLAFLMLAPSRLAGG